MTRPFPEKSVPDAEEVTPSQLPSIADVERDTGIAKDTLRVWERRYGFPAPLRDAAGERRYPAEQVHRLRVIRRLMDKGMRPGQLVSASLSELETHLDACPACTQEADHSQLALCDQVLALSKDRQLHALRAALGQGLARQGLQRFVIDTLPALLDRVGHGWLKGDIAVAGEHLLTEVLQNLLRSAIHGLPSRTVAHPSVLLTSLPDEDHGLGLLMAEALLESEHANCISLGLRTPLGDIANACEDYAIDVVAISVSAAYAPRKALQGLMTLRRQLPARVELWAGGAGSASHAKRLHTLAGVRVVNHISDTLLHLSAWRAAHGDSAPLAGL